MLKGILNNGKIGLSRQITLNNPLKWSCIGYTKTKKATSFYISNIDTLIDTGVLFYSDKQSKFIVPRNILITRNSFDHTRFLEFYENKCNILHTPLHIPGRTNNNNSYITTEEETVYSISPSYKLSVKRVGYTKPSYSYGLIYNNENQVIFMGNTTLDVLYKYNHWIDYSVVFIDCSMYNTNKHIHNRYKHSKNPYLIDIIPTIETHKDTTFILTNSSNMDLEKYNLDNVYLWND